MSERIRCATPAALRPLAFPLRTVLAVMVIASGAFAAPPAPHMLCVEGPDGRTCAESENRGTDGACADQWVKWQPGHYLRHTVYFREVDDPGKRQANFYDIRRLARNRGIKGVLLQIDWGPLEKRENEYDFSFIDETLDILEQENKYLILRVMDRQFGGRLEAFPSYLINGYDAVCSSTNDRNYAVASLWVPQAMDRFIALHSELAQAYDKHPRLVAIIPEETAIKKSARCNGFSERRYTDQLVRFNTVVGRKFRHTILAQSWNWLGSSAPNQYFDDITQAVLSHNSGGLSHPDTVPCRNGGWASCGRGTGESGQSPGYYYERRHRNELAILPQSQVFFEGQHPATNTMQEILDMAVDFLGGSHVVWDAWQRYFDMAVLNRNDFRVETRCPSRFPACVPKPPDPRVCGGR